MTKKTPHMAGLGKELDWRLNSNPSRAIGRFAWRREHGLLTWRDVARLWRARRYVPEGCRSPLPESLLAHWQEAPR